jgi:hypothetical protein
VLVGPDLRVQEEGPNSQKPSTDENP